MTSLVTITEIIGRAHQGITRPFICRGDDSFTYYVKGAYAGQRSLCCEWMANRLVSLVLPSGALAVPPFTMAEVPVSLIRDSARADVRDLGAGLVFASLRIENGQELGWTAAQDWSEVTKAQLLLLDLWLQNEDRSLSALGGNPNLMVEQFTSLPASEKERVPKASYPAKHRLWSYDFNLAFDQDFDRERFFNAHVFGAALRAWPIGFREQMETRLRAALNEVRTIYKEIPLEWLHVDGDESLPVQLDIERVLSSLELPFSESSVFWSLP